ncbi:hypothetical protein D9756_009000 [Leucocoprinus leucothites]|uniref:Methyltransferase type 11 domain-containing protein n=1 Tax=Leucocoprinus leucothites TaxID=201217 RepID=A0A8H5CYJ5_9AGAR|nr:hypothetical protein D9756_009000 [Leucoagaricus leucothites]
MSEVTHTHHHQLGHAHSHHHDAVAQANRDFFDDLNHDFDKIPHVKDRAARVVKAIAKAYPLDKENTTAMDFACGNGRVSLEMVPHVKSILGVDISQRMAEQYNENLKGKNASAVCVELKGEEGELSGATFDVVFCSSSYHHFASVDGITRILASFLKPGGALIVADMIHKEEGYEFMKNVGDAVPHKHGLSKGDMQKAFDGAGLTLRSFEELPDPTDHTDTPLFLAIGEKASA